MSTVTISYTKGTPGQVKTLELDLMNSETRLNHVNVF